MPNMAGCSGLMSTMVRQNSGLMNGIRNRVGRYVWQCRAQRPANTYSANFLGCQLLCAYPSPMRILDLPSYLLPELPKLSFTFMTQGLLKDQVVERLGRLAPEETDTVMGNGTDYVDWEKGILILLEKADMISADEGGEEEDKRDLPPHHSDWKTMGNLEDSARHVTGVLNITPVSICAVLPSGMSPSSSHVWTSEHVWKVRYFIDNKFCELRNRISRYFTYPFRLIAAHEQFDYVTGHELLQYAGNLFPFQNQHPTHIFAFLLPMDSELRFYSPVSDQPQQAETHRVGRLEGMF